MDIYYMDYAGTTGPRYCKTNRKNIIALITKINEMDKKIKELNNKIEDLQRKVNDPPPRYTE